MERALRTAGIDIHAAVILVYSDAVKSSKAFYDLAVFFDYQAFSSYLMIFTQVDAAERRS